MQAVGVMPGRPCRRCGRGVAAQHEVVPRHFRGGVERSVPLHFAGLCKVCRCENLFGKDWRWEFARRGIQAPC